jgi:trk system potassium uptake protein TrkH
VIGLALAGASPFDALVHTLAGVSTGGFAPRDASLAVLGSQLQYAVLGVSLLGAVSLPLYAELRRGRWKRLRDDPEARALLTLVAIVGCLLYVTGAGKGVSGTDLLLLSVSAQTTAGFATFPLDDLPNSAKAALVVSMLTGGSQGSTAGGLKLLRVLLVVRLLQWLVAQTRLPSHAISAPTLSGARLESPELLGAAAMILLFVGVVVGSWLPFLAYGYAPLDALFEVASATGTVGLSVGIARPALEPLLKAVLCFDMLLGRLEVFAVLVFLSPRTWIGRRVS